MPALSAPDLQCIRAGYSISLNSFSALKIISFSGAALDLALKSINLIFSKGYGYLHIGLANNCLFAHTVRVNKWLFAHAVYTIKWLSAHTFVQINVFFAKQNKRCK